MKWQRPVGKNRRRKVNPLAERARFRPPPLVTASARSRADLAAAAGIASSGTQTQSIEREMKMVEAGGAYTSTIFKGVFAETLRIPGIWQPVLCNTLCNSLIDLNHCHGSPL